MKEAAQYAESTQVLMNVSEFTDVSRATDTLISASQAFGYTADTSMEVVDLLNTIGNNYAISTADLAQSLTKSSASLVAAGGDLAEAAALTATANKIIQDADSVGTALKTTSLRLRGTDVKVLEEEGVDSDGAVASKSKLQGKVKALSGVDILTETGEYKSTYEILAQIADVWATMNDMDQAALLELISGKRNSSVIAAILQNPEELKAAFADANDASGSAWKENEKYLDSIQGKIDQFNNAVQTMWSNALDSDFVKGIVELGTEIIKIIDKIGLLNTALIALATYSMIKNKMGPLAFLSGISDFIRDLPKKITGFAKSFIEIPTATSKAAKAFEDLTVSVSSFQETMTKAGLGADTQQSVLSKLGLDGVASDFKINKETLNANALTDLANNGTLNKTQVDQLANVYGLRDAYKELTVEQMAATMSTLDLDHQQQAAIANTLGLGSGTKLLTQDQVVRALTSQGVAEADAIQAAAALGLTTTNKGLAASFTALWTALWPILAVMAGIAVIWGTVKLIDHLVVTTEELTEELGELKTELQDIQSEIETVNSELETMEDRMAELLAKDSLSFVEQEELDRLQKENNELQRRLDLLEDEEKIKQNKAAETFVQTMESYEGKNYQRDGEMSWLWKVFMADEPYAESQDEYINKLMEEYDKVLKVDSGELDRSALGNEMDADWYSKRIGEEVQALVDAADGLEYFEGDNLTDKQKEVNEWLDYVYNTQDKLAIMRGGKNAKTNAINRIFDKDENAEISDSIDEYVEALRNGDTSAKTSIENIISNNKALVEDLEASGLSADAAVEYFTSFASELEFATLEGKIKEVSSAAKSFESLLKGDLFKVDGVDTGLVDLFDEEGKIIQTKLSQVFQDTSDQTRAEITRLLEGSYDMIADGLDDGEINYLMNRMGLSFSRAILEIEKTNLANKNLELFPGLEDEISGIIDTFSELTSAVGSVVDALDTLDQARAEEAYSGSMSLETLEQLMQSTDNYADLIEVDETGAIHLASNAQEVLVAQKLEAIKKNAELALKEAELAYQEALHTEQTYSQTGPAQEFMRGLWNEVGGAMSFVSSLWSDLTNGNWDGAWDRAKVAREASITTKETEYANKAAAASAAVADAAQKVENAEKMNKIAQGLTPENVKARYSSDEASGGNSTTKDVAADAFQDTMDYWENRIAANQAKNDQIQNEIDRLEAQGKKAAPEYYEEQISLEEDKLDLLNKQKADALDYLNSVEEGSDEWWEAAQKVNDIESDIDDATKNIQSWKDAIAEVNWYGIEEPLTRFDNHTDTLETIRELVAPNGEEDWFDDEGMWTEKGVTVAGTYVQEIAMDEASLKAIQDPEEGILAKLSKPYEGNEEYYKGLDLGIDSEQDLYDKREEYQKKEQGYVKNISDNKQKLVDMYKAQIDAVEEYTQTLVDGYNDYIDSVKEALDAERDLYEFKKNVQKQAKDIAEIERRIASLSGSTNQADIAERRKLEAQLYEARESLNDTYYDHAKDAHQQALDEEAQAYEETMNKFIEGLRTSLDTALLDMNNFMAGVYNAVILNAPAIVKQYKNLGIELDSAIIDPWTAASGAIKKYQDGDKDNLGLSAMNSWIGEGGIFPTFKTNASDALSSPWTSGTNALIAFKGSVDTKMGEVVSAVKSNVQTASGKLSDLYKQIEDTEKKAAKVGSSGVGNTGKTGNTGNTNGDTPPKYAGTLTGTLTDGNKTYTVKKSTAKIYNSQKEADAAAQKFKQAIINEISSQWYDYKKQNTRLNDDKLLTSWNKKKSQIKFHATGTFGTKKDEWAITDERQFGDELVLVPGKDGNLSFMRKGTGVVPADMTKKLWDLAQIPTSDLIRKNITAIVPDITKTDIKNEFSFDSLVHVDHCDQNTLRDLERMIDNKINDFSKQMNYAIKKFTR